MLTWISTLGRDAQHQPLPLSKGMEIVKLLYTPQSLLLSIINIYKMGKAICARFFIANLGHLVSYHDKSKSKAPEHTAKRK